MLAKLSQLLSEETSLLDSEMTIIITNIMNFKPAVFSHWILSKTFCGKPYDASFSIVNRTNWSLRLCLAPSGARKAVSKGP